MKGWDSRRVIGDIKSRYSEWDTRSTRNPTGRNLYAAFYNGWLEGRLDMLQEIEKDLARNIAENQNKCQESCIIRPP